MLPESVDLGPHVPGPGVDLLAHEAADHEEQLQADQLGQSPQAQDSGVGRLGGPEQKGFEAAGGRAARALWAISL